MAPTSRLSSFSRLTWVFIHLVLGILPSFAFFAWVERNASLPRVGIELGWPWVSLQSWPTAMLVAWNTALFLAFGTIHSLLAQPGPNQWLRRIFPPQTIRAFYIVITGLSLTALMGLWQNTGVILWLFPLSPILTIALSMTLFWAWMGAAGWVMNRYDALEFIGLKQLYSSRVELDQPKKTSRLLISGIYARVRHPIYTLTGLAFILTPFMTLDRMVICGAMALYLSWAIPLEERKLVSQFGPAYERYRAQVPAVIPRFWR